MLERPTPGLEVQGQASRRRHGSSSSLTDDGSSSHHGNSCPTHASGSSHYGSAIPVHAGRPADTGGSSHVRWSTGCPTQGWWWSTASVPLMTFPFQSHHPIPHPSWTLPSSHEPSSHACRTWACRSHISNSSHLSCPHLLLSPWCCRGRRRRGPGPIVWAIKPSLALIARPTIGGLGPFGRPAVELAVEVFRIIVKVLSHVLMLPLIMLPWPSSNIVEVGTVRVLASTAEAHVQQIVVLLPGSIWILKLEIWFFVELISVPKGDL